MILERRLSNLLGCQNTVANCHNATIVFWDGRVPVGYTEHEDMEKWLKLNTWRVSQDMIQDGDILVLRDRNGLLHTAVLINSITMQFFHKPGIMYGWDVDRFDRIMSIYGEDVVGLHWHRVGSVITKV